MFKFITNKKLDAKLNMILTEVNVIGHELKHMNKGCCKKKATKKKATKKK